MDSEMNVFAKYGWPLLAGTVIAYAIYRRFYPSESGQGATQRGAAGRLPWNGVVGGQGGAQQRRGRAPRGTGYETIDEKSSLSSAYVDTIQAQMTSAGGVHPPFFKGSFLDVVAEASRSNKLIFLIIHNGGLPSETEIDEFLRETLCSPIVVDMLRENFITWIALAQTPEAHQPSQLLQATQFPHMAVLSCEKPSDASSQRRKLIPLWKWQGKISPTDLLVHLVHTIDQMGELADKKTKKQQAVEYERMLRAQQDLEYEEGLQRDKERRDREAAERLQREEEEQLRLQLEEEKRIEEERKEYVGLLQQLWRDQCEGKLASLQTESSHYNVAIRLPNGKRVEHKFNEACLLEALKDLVESKELLLPSEVEMVPFVYNELQFFQITSVDQLDSLALERPQEPLYNLVTTHPRQVLSDYDQSMKDVFGALRFGKNILLVVEPQLTESANGRSAAESSSESDESSSEEE